MNKKQLYENIMRDVRTAFSKSLEMTEGAWGYKPEQTDDALDMRGEFIKEITSLLEKKYYREVKSPDSAWSYIALIDYFVEFLKLKNETEIYMSKKLAVNFKQCVAMCIKDKEWIDGWSEPERMRSALADAKERASMYEYYAEKSNK